MFLGKWWQKLLGRSDDGSGDLADPEARAREAEVREQVRQRCRHFRHLLRANKRCLEWIGDIEEHLAGDRAFGMNYIRASSAEVTANVFVMIRELNALANDRYQALSPAFDRIRSGMEKLLVPVWHGQEGPYILPLTGIGLADLAQVGGKMANLGEIAANMGIRVPPGFVVTVAAYRRFMAFNDLGVELARVIQGGSLREISGLLATSQKLQQKILNATVPDDLREQIEAAVSQICSQAKSASPGGKVRLAVRSSAVGEDSLGASFAGQYRTEINVHPEEVCHVWKEIIASKYATSALSYRYQRGIPDEDAPMGVGVMVMVDALAGGVAYSRDPLAAPKEGKTAECILVNAVHGMPAAVVDGRVTPDEYLCSCQHPPQLLASRPATPDDPALDESQACQIARIALALEEYYNMPQDVEWAIERGNGQGGELVILQSRPLHRGGNSEAPSGQTASLHADRKSSDHASGPAEIDSATCATEGAGAEGAGADDTLPGLKTEPDPASLLMRGGIPVSNGVAFGQAFVAGKEADMLAFPEGAILVIARSHPRWAALLPHASGLVSESGGMAGHLASVAREYAIPALFSLPDACTSLANAGKITLDASRATIYSGDQRKFLPASRQTSFSQSSFIQGSPIWQRLQKMASLITPLNLLDPKAWSFAPEHCQTMHDLTRFCHEKAVEILFANNDQVDGQAAMVGKQLKAGSKLQYWLVDMGGGFARQIDGPTVTLQEIASKPMLALWAGMVSIAWNGPPVAGVGGFMSIVLESTMNPELETSLASPMAERNFFIVGADYMLLQARYGYHFCTVECQAGAMAHENFLSFQFKGGAADRERRLLRLKLLAEILEERNFRVDIKEDALFAVAEDFEREQTLRLTRLLGYLLIHSRQSDIIMKDPERLALFRSKLERDLNWLDGQEMKV